jgi:hypothetical protein
MATYIADPQRPTNAVAVQFHSGTSIDEASGVRSWLAAGGRFSLLRVAPAAPGGRSWQLAIEAGLDAMFDSESKLDNIGYDGNYGLTLTTAASGPLALKLALQHVSGHVGDEWAEETGRQRIGYTREEVAIGAARRVRALRLYGEAGYAFKQLNDDLQRPWRVQLGAEHESPQAFAGGRLGWYAAADFQSFEERDWRLDLSLEAGLLARSGGRRWRLGLRWVDGRPPLGEFFQQSEQWLAFGLWMDL